jgi:hypothetical protein
LLYSNGTQMAKSSKGTISIESVKGRLRLRFRVNKKQYTLGLGLRDNRDCRTKAALIARKQDVETDAIAADELWSVVEKNKSTAYRKNSKPEIVG